MLCRPVASQELAAAHGRYRRLVRAHDKGGACTTTGGACASLDEPSSTVEEGAGSSATGVGAAASAFAAALERQQPRSARRRRVHVETLLRMVARLAASAGGGARYLRLVHEMGMDACISLCVCAAPRAATRRRRVEWRCAFLVVWDTTERRGAVSCTSKSFSPSPSSALIVYNV